MVRERIDAGRAAGGDRVPHRHTGVVGDHGPGGVGFDDEPPPGVPLELPHGLPYSAAHGDDPTYRGLHPRVVRRDQPGARHDDPHLLVEERRIAGSNRELRAACPPVVLRDPVADAAGVWS